MYFFRVLLVLGVFGAARWRDKSLARLLLIFYFSIKFSHYHNFIFPFPALESWPKRYSDIIYQRAHPLFVPNLLLSKVAGGGRSF